MIFLAKNEILRKKMKSYSSIEIFVKNQNHRQNTQFEQKFCPKYFISGNLGQKFYRKRILEKLCKIQFCADIFNNN